MFSGHRLRILVLDDDERFLTTFEDLLSQDGHRVFPATRGLEAMEIVRRFPIDLSFLDYDLPDLDGIETFSRIHREDPDLPAIFVSGNPSSSLERMVLDAGGLALLRKPFDTNIVRVVIREAFHQQNPIASLKGELRWRN